MIVFGIWQDGGLKDSYRNMQFEPEDFASFTNRILKN